MSQKIVLIFLYGQSFDVWLILGDIMVLPLNFKLSTIFLIETTNFCFKKAFNFINSSLHKNEIKTSSIQCCTIVAIE